MAHPRDDDWTEMEEEILVDMMLEETKGEAIANRKFEWKRVLPKMQIRTQQKDLRMNQLTEKFKQMKIKFNAAKDLAAAGGKEIFYVGSRTVEVVLATPDGVRREYCRNYVRLDKLLEKTKTSTGKSMIEPATPATETCDEGFDECMKELIQIPDLPLATYLLCVKALEEQKFRQVFRYVRPDVKQAWILHEFPNEMPK